MIRTDCYLAVLKKYRKQYPNAHFEVITRTAKSVLSPSWSLLNAVKSGIIDFDEYKKKLIDEIFSRDDAINLIKKLKKMSDSGKIVFLVCYEKNADLCHRMIIKDIISNL